VLLLLLLFPLTASRIGLWYMCGLSLFCESLCSWTIRYPDSL
jgi:hypothetical protein